MKKLFIKNRKGLKMSVLIEQVKEPKGLVFVMHGLGGYKEQAHIKAFAESFKEKNFTVIRFDTTNSFNESEGDYENATTTNYYQDLEDLIKWSENQPWYEEPFVLVGHSLCGISVALFAQKYPKKVKAVAPISSVISGSLRKKDGKFSEEEMLQWEQRGYIEYESATHPGRIKRLPWSHMEDAMQYDLLKDAEKLNMAVLLIVGENDDHSPERHQRLLFDKLPGPKELHIIKGAPHTFQERKHLEEIKNILTKWIGKIN